MVARLRENSELLHASDILASSPLFLGKSLHQHSCSSSQKTVYELTFEFKGFTFMKYTIFCWAPE